MIKDYGMSYQDCAVTVGPFVLGTILGLIHIWPVAILFYLLGIVSPIDALIRAVKEQTAWLKEETEPATTVYNNGVMINTEDVR